MSDNGTVRIVATAGAVVVMVATLVAAMLGALDGMTAAGIVGAGLTALLVAARLGNGGAASLPFTVGVSTAAVAELVAPVLAGLLLLGAVGCGASARELPPPVTAQVRAVGACSLACATGCVSKFLEDLRQTSPREPPEMK